MLTKKFRIFISFGPFQPFLDFSPPFDIAISMDFHGFPWISRHFLLELLMAELITYNRILLFLSYPCTHYYFKVPFLPLYSPVYWFILINPRQWPFRTNSYHYDTTTRKLSILLSISRMPNYYYYYLVLAATCLCVPYHISYRIRATYDVGDGNGVPFPPNGRMIVAKRRPKAKAKAKKSKGRAEVRIRVCCRFVH